MRYTPNRLSCHRAPLEDREKNALGPAAAAEVSAWLELCPRHAPTRLHELTALAGGVGVDRLFVKDESDRLGLGSFKALGGAYAVLRLCLEHASSELGRPVDARDLNEPAVRTLASSFTVACATDGNHGRSVAAGARVAGCRAVIYVHEGVSAARARAIAQFGAEVRRVPGVYEDAVATAARDCEANGWSLVADTSSPGYERVPMLVMQGYTVMLREALEQLPATPTHVFVQCGVGGLAAAVAGYLQGALGGGRPRIVVVEPERAACLFASHEAGEPVQIPATEPTVMAMLECQEPSLVAWRVLSRLADGFLAVDEDDAVRAMRQYAEPGPGDPAIVAGESGAAGLAGLAVAAASPDIREGLGLDEQSVVLLFNTEGATDPETYRKLTGYSAEAVTGRG